MNLTNAYSYSSSCVWKIYAAATGSAQVTDLTPPTFNAATQQLQLASSAADHVAVALKDYWISAQEPNEYESARLRIEVVNPLTGKVIISGTAEVGQTLTSNIEELDGITPVSYYWNGGGTPRTNSTYTIDSYDLNSFITVTVTREGYTGSVTSNKIGHVTLPPSLTSDVTISGTARVGYTLTANVASGGSGTIRYQWKRNGVNIDEATGRTYYLVQDDFGTQISVEVSRTGNSGVMLSLPTDPVLPYIPPLTGRLSINRATDDDAYDSGAAGILIAGDTLDGSGPITYWWKRNGADIDGVNWPTYTIGQADIGKTISLEVSRAGYAGRITSRNSISESDDFMRVPITGRIYFEGDPTYVYVGDILTVKFSTISGYIGYHPITYQWKQNDMTSIGTNSPTYTIGLADVDKNISVNVSRYGYINTLYSTVGPVMLPLLKGSVSLSSDRAIVRQVIEAFIHDENGYIITDLTDFTYEWERSGVGGLRTLVGTNKTYLVTEADLVGRLNLLVRRRNYSGNLNKTVSVTPPKLTGHVYIRDNMGNRLISIKTDQKNRLPLGCTLSADTTEIDGHDYGPITYEWLRGATVISRTDTYVLSNADHDKSILLKVWRSGYIDELSTDAAHAIWITP
ncbi:hypothetical protein AGMMS4957_07920 [Bacteroidia bacterium]|nr:hypothetical protein AGMMS4957_07920 [Bacteroidia bacterium]